VKISLDSEERRQAHARAYWAWAKDNPTSALARFGGKPPAMFGQPAVGPPAPRRLPMRNPSTGRAATPPGDAWRQTTKLATDAGTGPSAAALYVATTAALPPT
jgi:hypothetical protein